MVVMNFNVQIEHVHLACFNAVIRLDVLELPSCVMVTMIVLKIIQMKPHVLKVVHLDVFNVLIVLGDVFHKI